MKKIIKIGLGLMFFIFLLCNIDLNLYEDVDDKSIFEINLHDKKLKK